MSHVFVDTSAFLALMLQTDEAHPSAKRAFAKLRSREASLLTTSYVLVETYALLGRRVGLPAVKIFRGDLAPLMEVAWVDEELHERALDLLLQRSSSRLSLVDATSFILARERNVSDVFAFDRDFEVEGFRLVR